MASFGGETLYPTLSERATFLAFSQVNYHAFIDGNKRIGYASLEVFLLADGFEIDARMDEQERLFLDLAAGLVTRDQLSSLISDHLNKRSV